MPESYSQFRDALLIALARKTERDGQEIYDLVELAEGAGLGGGRDRVRMACNELDGLGYLKAYSGLNHSAAELLGPGMEEAERLLAAEERVVEVDHSRPEYRELVAALADLAQAIRSNNEYSATEPEDQEQRLAEVEATQVLVRSRRVRVAVLGPLVSTLRYIGTKFGDSLIGQLARQAVDTLKEIF